MIRVRRPIWAAAAVLLALAVPGRGHAQDRISWERLSFWVENGPIASIPRLLSGPHCYDFILTDERVARLRSFKQGNQVELADLDGFLQQVARNICPDLLAPRRTETVPLHRADNRPAARIRVPPTGWFIGGYGFMPVKDPDQVNTGIGGGVKIGYTWSNELAIVADGRLSTDTSNTYDRLTRDVELLGRGTYPILYPVRGSVQFGGVYSNEDYATTHFDRLGLAGGVGLGVRLPYGVEVEIEVLEQILWTAKATVDGSEVDYTGDQPIGRLRIAAGLLWYPGF